MRGWSYPLFQLTNRRFIAADYSGDIDLAEAQIEPPFANGFADYSWLGGIAFYLRKVFDQWGNERVESKL